MNLKSAILSNHEGNETKKQNSAPANRHLSEGVKSAFEGNPVQQKRAAALIRDILGSPARADKLGKYTDVYNAASQGVRIENGTNKFVTFLEGAKAKP